MSGSTRVNPESIRHLTGRSTVLVEVDANGHLVRVPRSSGFTNTVFSAIQSIEVKLDSEIRPLVDAPNLVTNQFGEFIVGLVFFSDMGNQHILIHVDIGAVEQMRISSNGIDTSGRVEESLRRVGINQPGREFATFRPNRLNQVEVARPKRIAMRHVVEIGPADQDRALRSSRCDGLQSPKRNQDNKSGKRLKRIPVFHNDM